MTPEDKELLRLRRIEQLKRGRETAKANREAAAKAQATTTQTVVEEKTPVDSKATETPQREKRPISNLFGKKQETKKESPAENAVAGAPTAAKPEKKPSDFGEKLKRNWYFFLGGALIDIIGIPILLVGNSSANPIVIVFGAAISVIGGYFIYQGFSNFSVRVIQNKKQDKKNVVCNILKLKRDAVTFEFDAGEEHIGKEMKCRNDGKYYFVQYHGLDGNGTIEAFKIPAFNPDDQYYDPGEAVNVLFMAAVKAYLNYSASGLAKFSVVVLGIIIGVEIIGLIAIK